MNVATPVTPRVSPMVAKPETVKSSVVVNCSACTVPEAVTLPVTVWVPDASVPEVVKLSSPKEIAPSESVIEPSSTVRVPVTKLSAVTDPVVVRFSFPNVMAPDVSVIVPSFMTIAPVLIPPLWSDCAVKVATPVTARVSPTVASPETVRSSVVVSCSA